MLACCCESFAILCGVIARERFQVEAFETMEGSSKKVEFATIIDINHLNNQSVNLKLPMS